MLISAILAVHLSSSLMTASPSKGFFVDVELVFWCPAWGAALCAGSGVGLFASPRHDPRDLDAVTTRFSPDPDRSVQMAERYAVFTELNDALRPIWPRLEALQGPR